MIIILQDELPNPLTRPRTKLYVNLPVLPEQIRHPFTA